MTLISLSFIRLMQNIRSDTKTVERVKKNTILQNNGYKKYPVLKKNKKVTAGKLD